MLLSNRNYFLRQNINAYFRDTLSLDFLKVLRQLSKIQRSTAQHLKNFRSQPFHTFNILKFKKEVKVI